MTDASVPHPPAGAATSGARDERSEERDHRTGAATSGARDERSEERDHCAESEPDETGHFGPYGGRFVPEALVPALDQLTEVYAEARSDPSFQAELDHLQRTYAGRPTP